MNDFIYHWFLQEEEALAAKNAAEERARLAEEKQREAEQLQLELEEARQRYSTI